MTEITGEARCKCGEKYFIQGSALPSKRICSCGLKSTIKLCACGDIIIINESAASKQVTCDGCGRIIQKGVKEATSEYVGRTTERYWPTALPPGSRPPVTIIGTPWKPKWTHYSKMVRGKRRNPFQRWSRRRHDDD